MILGITGHRKLNNIFLIEEQIRKILPDLNPQKVISGMAVGYDQLVVKICKEFKVPFIAAIPFYGQEAMWPKEAIREYAKLIKDAEEIHYVSSPGYMAWKMQRRNEWIVDNCDLLLAYWDSGTKGGTYNCIKYAETKGREIKYLEWV